MMWFDAGSTKSLANVHRKCNLTVFALVTILVLRALEVPTCSRWRVSMTSMMDWSFVNLDFGIQKRSLTSRTSYLCISVQR